jgi:hypothetical protein
VCADVGVTAAEVAEEAPAAPAMAEVKRGTDAALLFLGSMGVLCGCGARRAACAPEMGGAAAPGPVDAEGCAGAAGPPGVVPEFLGHDSREARWQAS